jgi:hypothetical protein
MAAACQSPKLCTEIMKDMDAVLDPLALAIKESQDAFTGSDQERLALDKAYDQQVKVADLLTKLEEQMVPANYETPVPVEYSDLPQLKKRATVEMVVKKAEPGAQFDIQGVNYPQAKMVMVVDGYVGTNIFFWSKIEVESCLLFLTFWRLITVAVFSSRDCRKFCRLGQQGVLQ